MEADDSSSDEDDSIPLSQLFRFPKTPTIPIPNPSKTLKKFNRNDLVWAKTSPQTWSPAKITTIIPKVKAFVSLFGSSKTHVLNLSQICDFEENYGTMAKIAVPELSAEIEIALEELGHRASTGLMCYCRKSPNLEDPIGVSSEFEPKEMVSFVKEIAVCALVDMEEIARAVRLSSQVNAYWHYVSVCKTCGVYGELFAEVLVGCLKDLAICWGSGEWENESVSCEVEKILAYRRFVSVKPSWMFRQILEVEYVSDREEEDEDQDDTFESLSADELESGITSVLKNDAFSTEIQEDDCEICQEQIQQGRVLCAINRQDFTILDLDEEYEYMTPYEPDDAGEDNCSRKVFLVDDLCIDSSPQELDINVELGSFSQVMDTNQIEVIDALCTNSSSPESNLDTEIACPGSFSQVTYSDQIESKRTKFHDNEPTTSSEYHNVEYRASDITSENEKLEDESSIPRLGKEFPITPSRNCSHPSDELEDLRSCAKTSIFNVSQDFQCGPVDTIPSVAEASDEPVVKKRRYDIVNSSSISISSVNKKFLETAPCLRDPENESQTSPSEKILEINADQSTPLNTNSFSLSQKEATEGTVAKKRTMVSSSAKIKYSSRIMNLINCASDQVLSHFNEIAASKVGDKANISYGMKACRSSISHKKLHQRLTPDWHRFYVSPLTRCGLNSPSKARKSPSGDRINTSPRSLHMKFPRDFTLPPKEELERIFEMFGPLDPSRTKVFTYTGAAQVVFCSQASALAAHEYVKTRNVFGKANVRFWIDSHEKFRKGMQSKPIVKCSSLNLKSCLKRLERDEERDKDNRRVRFSCEKQPVVRKHRDQ